ncbi:hypothetical protein TNCV_4791551, partial [Trichonephila clavipes]
LTFIFLDGTARQWYASKIKLKTPDSCGEAFKHLPGLFVTVKIYQKGRRTTKMPSPAFRREYTVLHTKCIRTLPRGPVDERNQRHSKFYQWCNYIEDMKQKRVGRPRFERLPNVVPVASLTDETDLSLIRTIVREEVHRLVNQTQESLTPIPNP